MKKSANNKSPKSINDDERNNYFHVEGQVKSNNNIQNDNNAENSNNLNAKNSSKSKEKKAKIISFNDHNFSQLHNNLNEGKNDNNSFLDFLNDISELKVNADNRKEKNGSINFEDIQFPDENNINIINPSNNLLGK